MQRPVHCRIFLFALCVALHASAASAEEPARVADADRLAQLEARLADQHARLADLNAALTQQEHTETAHLRAAAMREQVRAILSEQEFRESLTPALLQAGYEDGFFIRSTDERFHLQFNAYMQVRWTHQGRQSRNRYMQPRLERDDITGFDLQRLVLEFSGHAYDPNLQYAFGIAMDAVDNNAASVDHAELRYIFDDSFAVTAGFFGTSSTRSNAIDPRNLAFVSRGLFDAVFGLGDGMGVRFSGALFDERLEYAFDIVNATADGEESAVDSVITTDPAPLDSNPALATRLVWNVIGDEPAIFESESAVSPLPTPALALGMHYVFNDNRGDVTSTRIPAAIRGANGVGPFGLVPSTGLQMHQFGVDGALRLERFALNAEYALRVLDVRTRTAPLFIATRQQDTTVQHGGYVQAGWFLPIPNHADRVELVGRVGLVSALANEQAAAWEYAAGVNYYIHGENVKLQADVTRVDNVPISANYHSFANVNDDILMLRMQLQVAF